MSWWGKIIYQVSTHECINQARQVSLNLGWADCVKLMQGVADCCAVLQCEEGEDTSLMKSCNIITSVGYVVRVHGCNI
jgi:hypothetical protein